MQSSLKLRLFADYFQFVLMDERSQGDFSTLWTEDALERMLAVGDCALAAGTLRNMEVDVEVEVLRARPEIVPGQWDNIVEASIRIPSGRLVVMGCTDYLTRCETDRCRTRILPVVVVGGRDRQHYQRMGAGP